MADGQRSSAADRISATWLGGPAWTGSPRLGRPPVDRCARPQTRACIGPANRRRCPVACRDGRDRRIDEAGQERRSRGCGGEPSPGGAVRRRALAQPAGATAMASERPFRCRSVGLAVTVQPVDHGTRDPPSARNQGAARYWVSHPGALGPLSLWERRPATPRSRCLACVPIRRGARALWRWTSWMSEGGRRRARLPFRSAKAVALPAITVFSPHLITRISQVGSA